MEKHKMETPELKNEFREEVRDPYAGISEEELIRRDQAVLLRELRLRSVVRELNRKTLEIVIEDAKALRIELLGMLKSPYREECIADLTKMIQNNEAQLNTNHLPSSINITLLALEELFAETVEQPSLTIHQSGGGVSNAVPEEVEDEDVSPELADEDDEDPG